MKLDKEFIEEFKKGKIVVNVETQAEYNEFIDFLENYSDITWADGKKPSENDCWRNKKNVILVSETLRYSTINTILGWRDKYTIIKYKDLKGGIK